MQRITISIDDDIAEGFDELCARKQYRNRSEAFRDLMRRDLAQTTLLNGHSQCVAVVSYRFNHHTRQLAIRMNEHQHSHTSLIVSTMHVHVSADECVETVVMRGPVGEVRTLAEKMIAETGIEEGQVQYMTVPEAAHHSHEHPHEHSHDHGDDGENHAHPHTHEHSHEHPHKH